MEGPVTGGYTFADQASGAREQIRSVLDVAAKVRMRVAAAVAANEEVELHLRPPSPAGTPRELAVEAGPGAAEAASSFVRERAALSPRAVLTIRVLPRKEQ
jgi:hypothetical protein